MKKDHSQWQHAFLLPGIAILFFTFCCLSCKLQKEQKSAFEDGNYLHHYDLI
ncbi:MAG: hypothetical protein MI921_01160 [Cytophagales bacterium]|nr:hypothetical protein [Cytophagales bacterium]